MIINKSGLFDKDMRPLWVLLVKGRVAVTGEVERKWRKPVVECYSGRPEGPTELRTCYSGRSEGPTELRTCYSGRPEGPTELRTCYSGRPEGPTELRTSP